MKKVLLIALAAAAMLAGGAERASAQKFELGARVGLGSQNMDIDALGLINGKNKLGWNLAAVGRIRLIGLGDGVLGAGLFLQPELVYSQSSFKGDSQTRSGDGGAVSNVATKVRMKAVDVPLLLSLKASIVRVQAGPVFNLMNNFDTVDGTLEFLPLRPAVGYALGASVDLLGLTFDGRYHGEFSRMSFKGDWADIKSRFSSWSLGVGIMF